MTVIELVALYLGAGAIVALSTVVAVFWRDGVVNVIRRVDPAGWAAAGIIGLMGLTLWPAALVLFACWAIVGEFKRRKDSTASKAEAPKFQVRPEHVGLVMTVDEIEAAERVTDPLGAVPNLPFGHLNKAWRRFLSQMPAGGSLAHFSAEWTAPWGGQERLDGYVVVDGGRLGPFWACRATRG